ncbi:MAG: hypothetical protein ABDH31_01800 [Chlorobiota bacterium]
MVALLLALLLPLAASAQGFPWELSPRLPVAAPRWFIGAGSSFALLPSTTTLQAIEGGWTCATYRSGAGAGLSATALAELWLWPESSLQGALSVEHATLTLAAPAQPLPLADGRLLETEFQLRLRLLALRAEVTWKRQLYRWLWIGASGWAALQWRTREEQWEVVRRPEDFFFRTLPPSRERRLGQSIQTAFRPYGVGLRLRVGYDLPLARFSPLYLSPSVFVGTSLISLLQTAAWQRYEIGVTTAVLWGLTEH